MTTYKGLITMQTVFLTALVLLLLTSLPRSAQSADFRGSLETEIALTTHQGNVQKADLLFRPEWRGDLSSWGTFTIIGQLRVDPADKLEPGSPDQSNDVRGSFSRRKFAGDIIEAELREIFVDVYFADNFLRVGKQQVVWGQADGLRVLDAVNPLHFREFIIGDLEQRRIPLWMVNFERPLGDGLLQFLWIPDKTYNDFPQSGAFSAKSTLFQPVIPKGNEAIIEFPPIDKPDNLISDDDYGIRLTGFNAGWDWSVNYLYTYDDNQVVRREALGDNVYQIKRNYERTHMVGASASNAFGKTTWRFETGWFSDRFFLIDDLQDADGVVSSPEISYVIGVDYQPTGDLFLSTQVFQSILLDAPVSTRRDETQTNLTFLARQDFLNDSLEAEILLIVNADDGDGLVQMSLEYEMTDSILVGVGVDVFFGNEQELFGQFDANDQVKLLLSYGF